MGSVLLYINYISAGLEKSLLTWKSVKCVASCGSVAKNTVIFEYVKIPYQATFFVDTVYGAKAENCWLNQGWLYKPDFSFIWPHWSRTSSLPPERANSKLIPQLYFSQKFSLNKKHIMESTNPRWKFWKLPPKKYQKAWVVTGKCLTPTQLLICSSFSRENGHPLLICSSLSTSQLGCNYTNPPSQTISHYGINKSKVFFGSYPPTKSEKAWVVSWLVRYPIVGW